MVRRVGSPSRLNPSGGRGPALTATADRAVARMPIPLSCRGFHHLRPRSESATQSWSISWPIFSGPPASDARVSCLVNDTSV
jgi:hypothetical protein